jgi:hypothetical protein
LGHEKRLLSFVGKAGLAVRRPTSIIARTGGSVERSGKLLTLRSTELTAEAACGVFTRLGRELGRTEREEYFRYGSRITSEF